MSERLLRFEKTRQAVSGVTINEIQPRDCFSLCGRSILMKCPRFERFNFYYAGEDFHLVASPKVPWRFSSLSEF